MATPSPRLPLALRRVVHQLSAAQAAVNARRALEHDHLALARVESLVRKLEVSGVRTPQPARNDAA